MKRVELTNIKLACTLTVLLNCKKHTRKDIKEVANQLLSNYQNVPEIAESDPIDDSFLSQNLNPLVKEEIIESKIIPAEGRGPPKYQHSLIVSIDAFKKIAEIFMSLYYFEIFVVSELKLSLGIIRSPYGRKCITTFLMEWLESILEEELTEKEKYFILILIMSFPLALFSTITIHDKIEDFLSNFSEIKINFNKKEFYLSELIKSLDFDVCNPFLEVPYSFEYNHSLKLKPEITHVLHNKAFPEFDIRNIFNPFRTYINTEKNEIRVRCGSSIKSKDKSN